MVKQFGKAIATWATIALLAVLTVACSRGGSTATSAATTTVLNPRYAYAANSGDNSVAVYLEDASAGRLKYIGKAATGLAPASVTVDPAGKFAYVANYGSNTISQYTIGADGSLNPMAVASVAAGQNPKSITIDPGARYAYVANYGSNTISQYTIGADGSLAPMGIPAVAAGTAPESVTIDPSGKYVYAANSGSDTISQFTIGTNGSLTSMIIPMVATGKTPKSVAVDPSGKYAYAANSGNNTISQFMIDTDGNLIPMSTAAAGTAPGFVTVDPGGKYAYVANQGSGDISAYSIKGTTGALTQISCGAPGVAGCSGKVEPTNFVAESNPHAATTDPSGKYLYVANNGSNSLSQYAIGTSGNLMPVAPATVAAQTGPVSLTMIESRAQASVESRYTYVTNVTNNNVTQYGPAAAIPPGTANATAPAPVTTQAPAPATVLVPVPDTAQAPVPVTVQAPPPATVAVEAAPYVAPVAITRDDDDTQERDSSGHDPDHADTDSTQTPREGVPVIVVPQSPRPYPDDSRETRPFSPDGGRSADPQHPAGVDSRTPATVTPPDAAGTTPRALNAKGSKIDASNSRPAARHVPSSQPPATAEKRVTLPPGASLKREQ